MTHRHIETIAFHCGIIVACYVTLTLVEKVQFFLNKDIPISDIKREFRSVPFAFIQRRNTPDTTLFPSFSLIPLTLFYSSLTKLFLLFLLTIWRPLSTSVAPVTPPLKLSSAAFFYNKYLLYSFEILDDDKLDREWAIRNVLGGMSAGFGLRGMLIDVARRVGLSLMPLI